MQFADLTLYDALVAIGLAVLLGLLAWRLALSSSSSNSAQKSRGANLRQASSKTMNSAAPGSPPAQKKSLGSNSRDIVSKMRQLNKNVVVFYGSQTGTAEDYANRIAREGNQYGLHCMTADIEEYDLEELVNFPENHLAFFIMATYGEGEPTDNAQQFYQWLVDSGNDASLKTLHYIVFGLGNKTYEQFNAVARVVDKRLEECGAVRVMERGEGDDDGNLEDDFLTWKERMWPLACEFFGVDPAAMSTGSVRAYSFKELAQGEYQPEKVFHGEIGSKLRPGAKQNRAPFDSKNPYYSIVTHRHELTAPESTYHTPENDDLPHRVLHLELSIPKDTGISYQTGDHVAVYPANDAGLVMRLAKRLGIEEKLDNVFTMTAVDEAAPKKHPFPCPTTFRAALSRYLDITTPPRLHVLRTFSEYATDPAEKEFLEKITQPSSKAAFNDWLHKSGPRTLLSILESFPSVQIPIDHLMELLTRLQVRYYSISSSPKAHPESIHITFSLLHYRAGEHVVKGVATNHLLVLETDKELKHTYGDLVSPLVSPLVLPIFVRNSSFKLPKNPALPIICIGPGTGLAPFRGFVQERDWLKRNGKETGEMWLFFGCRRRDHDYLYREELEAYHASKVIHQLVVAFSRETSAKVYVQHKLMEYKEELWNLIEKKNAHIYVCGDAKNMARDVNSSLIAMARECGGKSESEAVALLKELRSRGRYAEDVWS